MSAEKEQVKVLKGKRLIDGNGGEPVQNAVMVIEGQRIKEVGSEGKVTVPAGAEVIDMGDCTLMPGLIDCHMHPPHSKARFFRNMRVASYEVFPQLQELYALFHVQFCLEHGFTSLRDGANADMYGECSTPMMVAVREAINNGLFAGPRILVGGLTVHTNSHLAHPSSYVRVSPDLTADGPWEMRKLARRQLRMQADFIKTCASGGGGTAGEEPDVVNMTQEELDAVADEAHAFGKQCVCHCFTPLSQKKAVRAGVDTIEHCVFTDDEAVAMMKEANKPLIPTLAHRTDREIAEWRDAGMPEFTTNKLKRIQPYCWETFKKIHKAGIKIAMGTDAGLDSGLYEIEIYVSLGMTPMEALQTATKNAAEAIWLGNDTGTLDVGKYADVIAINGDPLQNIKVFQDRNNTMLVMKEGTVHIDKRKGHEKSVIQNWNWKIID
ncbi:amidohydrolase family protein [Chloroflexota bacterium]